MNDLISRNNVDIFWYFTIIRVGVNKCFWTTWILGSQTLINNFEKNEDKFVWGVNYSRTVGAKGQELELWPSRKEYLLHRNRDLSLGLCTHIKSWILCSQPQNCRRQRQENHWDFLASTYPKVWPGLLMYPSPTVKGQPQIWRCLYFIHLARLPC